jgi:hypothetical protein
VKLKGEPETREKQTGTWAAPEVAKLKSNGDGDSSALLRRWLDEQGEQVQPHGPWTRAGWRRRNRSIGSWQGRSGTAARRVLILLLGQLGASPSSRPVKNSHGPNRTKLSIWGAYHKYMPEKLCIQMVKNSVHGTNHNFMPNKKKLSRGFFCVHRTSHSHRSDFFSNHVACVKLDR